MKQHEWTFRFVDQARFPDMTENFLEFRSAKVLRGLPERMKELQTGHHQAWHDLAIGCIRLTFLASPGKLYEAEGHGALWFWCAGQNCFMDAEHFFLLSTAE